MTPLTNLIGLQDALCEEVRKILGDFSIVNSVGEHKPFHVYAQQLPRTMDGTDPTDDPEMYPFALVSYSSSHCETNLDDDWTVEMFILLGLYDEAMENQGQKLLIPAMERITARFLRAPLLEPCWVARPEMDMEMQQSDQYPYFYGQVRLVFDQHRIWREDPLDAGYSYQFQEARRGEGGEGSDRAAEYILRGTEHS